MTNMIKVINKNDFDIVDYFDGLAYKFIVDEPISVPIEAMQHIFGMDFPSDETALKSRVFRDELFNSVSKRWGWNSHNAEELKKNRTKLDNIAFIPIMTKTVEIVADKESIAEPREQKTDRKTSGKFKPRHDEETSEEEVA